MPHPLMGKVTGAHVAKILELEEKSLDYSHQDRRDARRYGTWAGIGLAVLASVVILVLALTNHEALVSQLIPLAAAFVGGFGGGYGLGTVRQRR